MFVSKMTVSLDWATMVDTEQVQEFFCLPSHENRNGAHIASYLLCTATRFLLWVKWPEHVEDFSALSRVKV
jgi:hypothetical protein